MAKVEKPGPMKVVKKAGPGRKPLHPKKRVQLKAKPLVAVLKPSGKKSGSLENELNAP